MQTFFPHKTILLFFSAAFLAGCAGGPFPFSPSAKQTAQSPLARAFCMEAYEDAFRILDAAPSSDEKTLFWRGYFLEKTGQVIKASAVFDDLAKRKATPRVSLSCNGQTLINGSVSVEATKRLSLIDRDLKALDVAQRNVPTRLKRRAPTTDKATVALKTLDTAANGPAVDIKKTDTTINAPAPKPKPRPKQITTPVPKPKPKKVATKPVETGGLVLKPLVVEIPPSQSAAGAWFAHLASYSSAENADNFLSVLEGKYPALTGVIVNWTIDADGTRSWRMGVRADDWADVDRLCVVIRSKGDYCKVLDTRP